MRSLVLCPVPLFSFLRKISCVAVARPSFASGLFFNCPFQAFLFELFCIGPWSHRLFFCKVGCVKPFLSYKCFSLSYFTLVKHSTRKGCQLQVMQQCSKIVVNILSSSVFFMSICLHPTQPSYVSFFLPKTQPTKLHVYPQHITHVTNSRVHLDLKLNRPSLSFFSFTFIF